MPEQFKIEGISAVLNQLGEATVSNAIRNTLNDLAKTTKVQTAKVIGKRYTLKAKRIKDGISVKRVSTLDPQRMVAYVSYIGRTPGLQHYRARFKQGKASRRGYRPPSVTVEVVRGQRKKISGGFSIPGIQGIFERQSSGRYPLKRLPGPSPRGMFKAAGGSNLIRDVLQPIATPVFNRHLKREIFKRSRRR